MIYGRYNRPNGIADVLDEAKWGLDWNTQPAWAAKARFSTQSRMTATMVAKKPRTTTTPTTAGERTATGRSILQTESHRD